MTPFAIVKKLSNERLHLNMQITYPYRKFNRPFPHSAPVSKHKNEVKARVENFLQIQCLKLTLGSGLPQEH